MAADSTLETLQRTMLGYLLETPERDSPEPAAAMHALLSDASPAVGLSIYSRAYRSRLVEALINDHEKLHRFLGAENFQTLAEAYVISHPSRVRSLRHYGTQFPEFLEGSNHPDAARISALGAFERLLLDVYDAEFANQPDYEQLSRLPPEHWPALQLSIHPSARLFSDPHGAVAAWQACNNPEGSLPQVAAKTKQSALTWIVWRDRSRVCQFRHLGDDERSALDAMLLKRQTLAQTAEQLSEVVPQERLAAELQQWLAQWFNDGLVAEFQGS